MADLTASLAYQFQQLAARFDAALAAQLDLALERETHQRALDGVQERQQTQEQTQGMSY